MNWQDRISTDAAVLAGKPVIKGTRVSVALILDLLAGGWTEAEILENYPHVDVEDIRACLYYAADLLQRERIYPVPAP